VRGSIHEAYLNQMSIVDEFLIISVVEVSLGDPRSAQSSIEERDAIEQVAQWEWNPTYRDSCFGLQFGAWVRVPAKTKRASKYGERTRAR
jgi:hypothetical protein